MQHKDSLKVQEITAVLECWMQVGYQNQEVAQMMKGHVRQFHKLLSFDPNDIYVLL